MLSGVVGHIKWGHYTAAAINGYTVAPTNKARTAWQLTATVVLADPFKMTQTPLFFVAPHAKGEWRFPVVSMQRHEHVLRAALGAPLAFTKG